MKSNRKPIKIRQGLTILFVLTVLILTFYSKTLYNRNLPTVSYTNPTPGALKRVFSCETLATAKTEYDLYAPSMQKVLEVSVGEGDHVKKDQVLVRLDTAGLDIELLQLEYERQLTLDSEQNLSSEAYKLALKAVESRIEAKQAEITGSVITAPADGYVTALTAKVGMTTNTAEPLITVGTVENGLQAALYVTQLQAAWFTKDDKLSIYIPLLNRSFDGFVSRIQSSQDGGMVVLVDISDPSGDIPAGQIAEVSFTKMTGDYLTLVPLSALHNDGNNYIFKLDTVQGPLGVEYRLYKNYVRVLDQDDTNAALEAEINPVDHVVTWSDRELYGGRVKLRED